MAQADLNGKEYCKYLRRCFEESGGKGMSLDELLATVLSFSDCAENIGALMAALNYRFEPVSDCFRASYSELMTVCGMTHRTAVLIMLVGTTGTGKVPRKSMAGIDDLCKVFGEMLSKKREEELWAAALDDDGSAIAIERMSKGMRGAVDISISRIAEFAARHGSRSLIVAHSHPDIESAAESRHDETAMMILGTKLRDLGIDLMGEVVVSDKNAAFLPFTCTAEAIV